MRTWVTLLERYKKEKSLLHMYRVKSLYISPYVAFIIGLQSAPSYENHFQSAEQRKSNDSITFSDLTKRNRKSNDSATFSCLTKRAIINETD